MSDVLLKSLSSGLVPPSRLGIIKWAEEHVRFPHSDRNERFTSETAPWMVEPLTELADNTNEEIVCRAAVGSSKTTAFEVALPYIISEDPGPTMVITQTDDDTKEWAETRLQGVLKGTAPCADLIPHDRRRMRKDMYLLPHMFVALGGANISTLQSKSIRWCLGDEVWQWKSGMLDEFRGRRHDRWNARMFLVSQGGAAGDDFSNAYEQTDQRVYHWCCSECGHEQPYKWTQIKWDDVWVNDEEGGEYDWDELAKTVRLECDKCGHAHADTIDVRRNLSTSARFIPTNPNAKNGHVGFWWNALCVYWIPWDKLVWQWLRAIRLRREGDEEPFWIFKQKRLAEDREENPEVDRAALSGAGYSLIDIADPAQKWPGEIYRFCTSDKQRDHFWTCIRAWMADGSSKLLFYGRTLTFEGIRELQLSYGVKDRLTTMDAQYDTPIVYRKCAEYDWTALHGGKEKSFVKWVGRGKQKTKVTRFTSDLQKANLGGGKYARYMFMATDRLKDILLLLRTGGGVQWDHPDDVSESWLKQIDSEAKKEVINRSTKKTEIRWVQVKKHNHAWDCEYHQVAMAYTMGILGDFTGPEDPDPDEPR